MRHNFLIILLLCSISCSKKTDTDFAVLNNTWAKNKHQWRMLASLDEPECRSNFFNKEMIAKENRLLESKIEKSKKASGLWKHLQLANLPIAQANFLLKYDLHLGDLNKKNYDFSLCQDVPCIINTIYESTDGLEGQVIYNWYLKMGSLLDLDNQINDQVSTAPGIYFNKIHPFKNYLFSRDELYGFWRLTQTLPPTYQMLSNLDIIERIPKNVTFEGASPNTCGMANNMGNIRLADNCLKIGNEQTRGEGYFYQATTHELTHELDFLTALSIKPQTYYYSHTNEWMNEGGWFITEVLDASTGAIKLRQWNTNQDPVKFVSAYAGTNPQEHFAESLSMLYDSADISKKTLPETTYQLIQKKFFNNQEFDSKYLKADFLAVADSYDLSLFRKTEECLKNPLSARLAPADLIFANFFPTIKIPEVKNCLAAKMKEVAQQVMKDINRTKFYGCEYTKGKEAVPFKTELVTSLSNKMIHHHSAYLEDKEYFNLFTQFYKQFETIREAQIAYMNCQGENDEVLCYEAAIKKQIVELLPPEFEFKEVAIFDLHAQYLKKYPWQVAHDETLKIYQQFVISSQTIIQENANHLWEGCSQEIPDDTESPLGFPFSAKTQYVVSSFMNCLNQSISSSLEKVVDELNADILIKNEKEKRLIRKLALPITLKTLDELLVRDVATEIEEIKLFKSNTGSSLKEKMLADFSWVKHMNKKQLALDCQALVVEKLKISLYFHQEKKIFDELSNEVCSEVLISPELNNHFEKIYSSSWEAAEENLKLNFTNKGTIIAKDCLGFYPKSIGILERMNSNRRLTCFQDNWAIMELTAMREFNASGPGSKHLYDPIELRERTKIIVELVKLQLKKLYLQ